MRGLFIDAYGAPRITILHGQSWGDDDALNASVARYRADPAAEAKFAADAGLQGRIAVPVRRRTRSSLVLGL